MVDFAKLAAEAKARRTAKEQGLDSSDSSTSAPVSDGNAESGIVQGAQEATPSSTPVRKNPFARKPVAGPATDSNGTGTPDGGKTPADSGSADDNKPALARINLAAASATPRVQSGDTKPLDTGLGLSLESLSETTDEGVAPRTSGFVDETPATRPTRELPDGLTKDALGFMDMVDGVYDVLHEADLLGGVIRNILIELKSHPEYMRLVADEDIRAWVRGMRESMGLAKVKKTEAKAKRSGGAGKKSKLVDADMLADLESLGIA